MAEAAVKTSSREDARIGASSRALLLHDSVAFLVLILASLALFGITLFLFRSFDAHRAALARQSADRGRLELAQHQPAKAVASLRSALSYEPDDYASQLLLAQALADAGDTDQATAYFENLWSARPGDGFLNLQLARLARTKGNRIDANKYYRASIFGDWRGDGTIKRRDVRLELIDYLIEQRDFNAARVELIIAAGNAPASLHLNALIADKLRAADDPNDALAYYQKAVTDQPHNASALRGAGQISYGQGNYEQARDLLDRAIASEPTGQAAPEDLRTMARDAGRLVELSLSRELPAHERARHLLTAAKIAQARLASCSVVTTDPAQVAAIEQLQIEWRDASEGPKRNALVENAAGQDNLTQLIFDTELDTARICGQPTGDDALLLKLTQREAASEAAGATP